MVRGRQAPVKWGGALLDEGAGALAGVGRAEHHLDGLVLGRERLAQRIVDTSRDQVITCVDCPP